jgi:hypothetical protein
MGKNDFQLHSLAEDWEDLDEAIRQRQNLPYLSEVDNVFLEWIRLSIHYLKEKHEAKKIL